MNPETSPENKRQRFADLAVFTTTMYGNDRSSMVRRELATEFFQRLRDLHITSSAVDGGSPEDFHAQLPTSENMFIERAPELNLGASRREALRLALEQSQVEFLMWAEPEKGNVITENNIEAILAPLRSHAADIVIPKRISKESYPHFQAWIEQRGNKRMNSLANHESEEIDFWFGPRAFNRNCAKYFSEYQGSGWDSIFVPLLNAVRDGRHLASVPVEFTYPPEQRAIEEETEYLRTFKLKRLEQYRNLIQSLTQQE